MAEGIIVTVVVAAVVAGFFYWRGHKQKVRDRIRNAIDKAKQ